MNNYGKLIESHMISFKEVLVMNYKAIGLNETEAMVIILLYEQKKHKNNALSVSNILKYVTLKENELSKMIVSLVERDYIELIFEDNNVEKFSLTPTIDKLGSILENLDKNENGVQDDISKIISYLETAFQKQLSASELVVVQRWISENKSMKDIMNAVNETLRLGKYNVKYADAILSSKTPREKANNIDPEIQKVLKQINVKHSA